VTTRTLDWLLLAAIVAAALLLRGALPYSRVIRP